MIFQIKSRYSGSVMFSLECGSLKLCVEAAVKSRADLSGANLSGADLSDAYLSGADLSGADLSGADLSGATGCAPELVNPLLMLKDQPGDIILYKLVNEEGVGPFNGGITYDIGKSYEVLEADTNPAIDCGKGINVATLPWCLKEWREGYSILTVKTTAKDIACIPNYSDGKIRLFRCTVMGVKELDYARIFPKAKEKAEVKA